MIYKGIILSACGPQLVVKGVKLPEGGYSWREVLDPRPSQKVYNHAEGFQWGYVGSGPAQLALALLLDTTKNPELSLRLHQSFKTHCVAGWGERWTLSSDDILVWVEENQ